MIDLTKLSNLAPIAPTSLAPTGIFMAQLIDVEDYTAAKGTAGHRFIWTLLEEHDPALGAWITFENREVLAINSIVGYGVPQTNKTADGVAFTYLPEAKFIAAVRRNAKNSKLDYAGCIQYCLDNPVICTAVRDSGTDAVWFSVSDSSVIKDAAKTVTAAAPSGTAERFAL